MLQLWGEEASIGRCESVCVFRRLCGLRVDPSPSSALHTVSTLACAGRHEFVSKISEDFRVSLVCSIILYLNNYLRKKWVPSSPGEDRRDMSSYRSDGPLCVLANALRERSSGQDYTESHCLPSLLARPILRRARLHSMSRFHGYMVSLGAVGKARGRKATPWLLEGNLTPPFPSQVEDPTGPTSRSLGQASIFHRQFVAGWRWQYGQAGVTTPFQGRCRNGGRRRTAEASAR